jgi:hypothetical protein
MINTTLRPNKDRRNPTKSNLTTGVQRVWFCSRFSAFPVVRSRVLGNGAERDLRIVEDIDD